ncbi:Flagellin FlgL [Cohaesibacter marisflavi]|uniref:Flagellin FlgL n=1 Tax=Cohaesibacter marisflavi TaxID=655353 RepID=A0A1I5J011_9HYPH|nr:hypothetical protein [Cohaesibacter marisflavi]SFO66174.1 Flagellin FlgL [Cohaesibacter marisflavi]
MIGTLNGFSSSVMMNVLRNNSSLMQDLTIQLSTGKKAQTYGGLGRDAGMALDYRSQITSVKGYQSSIEQAQVQISMMNLGLERVVEIGAEISGSATGTQYDISSNNQSVAQVTAATLSREMIGILNTEVDGDFVFSGTTTDVEPAINYDRIVYGYGGEDGLLTVTDERIRADAGADGLGRLDLSTVGPTMTLSEEVTDFGYKLSAVTSTLSNVTVAGPAGSPASIDVTVTGEPVAGQVLSFTFDMPDGSSEIIQMTGHQGATSPSEGKFSVSGAPGTIATAIQDVLTYQLGQNVASAGEAASRIQGSMDFFLTSGGGEPKRVVGVPETATTLDTATAAGKPTLNWYVGDNDALVSSRDTAKVQIDNKLDVSYGARANEDSIARQLAYMTAFSLPTYDQNSDADEERYTTFADAISSGLSSVNQGDVVKTTLTEIGVASKVMEDANLRHHTSLSMLQTALTDKEGINDEEVAAKIMTIRTTIEASYQAASMMYNLSLTKFI